MRPTTPSELKAYQAKRKRLIWFLTGIVTALAILMVIILIMSRP